MTNYDFKKLLKAQVKKDIEEFITDMFVKFQEDNNISAGDLDVMLEFKLQDNTENLVDTITDAMIWQYEYK